MMLSELIEAGLLTIEVIDLRAASVFLLARRRCLGRRGGNPPRGASDPPARRYGRPRLRRLDEAIGETALIDGPVLHYVVDTTLPVGVVIMPSSTRMPTASLGMRVAACDAFGFLACGLDDERWALGNWHTDNRSDGLLSGTSPWDTSVMYIRATAHQELQLVDYAIGPNPADLRRLIQARVVGGEAMGADPETSVITLSAWRDPRLSERVWQLTPLVFETELRLIRRHLDEYARRVPQRAHSDQ